MRGSRTPQRAPKPTCASRSLALHRPSPRGGRCGRLRRGDRDGLLLDLRSIGVGRGAGRRARPDRQRRRARDEVARSRSASTSTSPMSMRPRKLAPSTMITRGADVAHHPALPGDLDRLGGGDVPHHHAGDHAFLTATSAFTTPVGSTMRVFVRVSVPSTRPRTVRSSSPLRLAADEDRLADDGAAVAGRHGPSPSAFLDVHVDVALERGAVGDEDARGADVAHHAAVRLELDLVARRDVARSRGRPSPRSAVSMSASTTPEPSTKRLSRG